MPHPAQPACDPGQEPDSGGRQNEPGKEGVVDRTPQIADRSREGPGRGPEEGTDKGRPDRITENRELRRVHDQARQPVDRRGANDRRAKK